MSASAASKSESPPVSSLEAKIDETAPEAETVAVADRLHSVLSAQPLTVVVFGASGHLARTKTFPALYELFEDNVFPTTLSVVGFARSEISDKDFKDRLRTKIKGAKADDFLARCSYFSGGSYTDPDAYKRFEARLQELEDANMQSCKLDGGSDCVANRLFYLATPPGVFTSCAEGIKNHLSTVEKNGGWVRVIVEKPFGKDGESCKVLLNDMAAHLRESQMYRIDHYLAKEMVQNIMVLRFGNTIWDTIWNRRSIKCVKISMKEADGVAGRGGYYDEYGVIRDVFQNHLLQVLSLIAMEAPVSLTDDDIRDEKVKLLRAIKPLTLDKTVVGQYTKSADGSQPGYIDDESVKDDSNQLTFMQTVLYVNNSRWSGVPFICKCGKGLDERSGVIRIQFENDGLTLYPSAAMNELVIRLQPKEAMWLKVNTKKPGYARMDKAYSNFLDLTYQHRFEDLRLPQAYTRLILDALQGDQSLFVRDDELREAWRIVDPVLAEYSKPTFKPELYPRGSRGPPLADKMAVDSGFHLNQQGGTTPADPYALKRRLSEEDLSAGSKKK